MSHPSMKVRAHVREEQRQKNREAMPNLAALVDELRERFPGAKVMWGQDLVTGKEVGKRDDEDPEKVFCIPEDYHPTRSVDVKEMSNERKGRSKTR